MKKEKLNAIQLFSGVDTLEIRTEKEIEPKGQADFVPKEGLNKGRKHRQMCRKVLKYVHEVMKC